MKLSCLLNRRTSQEGTRCTTVQRHAINRSLVRALRIINPGVVLTARQLLQVIVLYSILLRDPLIRVEVLRL